MTPSTATCLLLASTLLLAACTTPSRETTQTKPAERSAPPVTKRENPQNLRKGMTAEQIRAVWGEPKSVHTTPEGDTVLVYQFDVRTTQRMVATAMTEVPAFDPINGAPIKLMEPTYSPQNVTVYQTIVLQLKGGVLAAWARQLGEHRNFN